MNEWPHTKLSDKVFFYVLGIGCAVAGIWQGWAMRDQPDLDIMSTAAGVIACWVIIYIGRSEETKR